MKPWRQADKIGAVIHGPEIVDTGCALGIVNYLKKFGDVHAVLGGTMGRVAILDAGLDKLIDISPRRRPSQSIRDLEATCDLIFLLNYAKSRESGLAFGSMVAAAARAAKPLIQIDCGGRFVADLSFGAGELANTVAVDLKLDILETSAFNDIFREGNVVKRILRGVDPGEPISVNGTVIGKATGGSVEIESIDNMIVSVKGANIKSHGLEKLPFVDLEKAIIRSGNIRRTKAASALTRVNEEGREGAAFIDHCAEDAFEIAYGVMVAVTVGDDTTAIAGEILARMGINVVGIVDGDLDWLAGRTKIQRGGVVIKVRPGYDDMVGMKVKQELFRGGKRAMLGKEEVIRRITEIAGDFILRVDRY
jgi:hypothetical protein